MADFSDITADKKPAANTTNNTTASAATNKTNSASTPNAVTGTVLRVIIKAESWDKPGTLETLNCGAFEIDGMDYDDSAAGSIATIRGVSVPLKTSIRREVHSQGWEKTTLKAIADEIARRGGMSLMYELDDDPSLDRVDQKQEGDLAFLHRICKEHGAKLKVIENRIVIYDEAKYEARPTIVTFKRGDGRLLSISLRQDSSNVASSATATYKDPKSGKLVQETFTPTDAPAVGQNLIINTRPSDLSGDSFRAGVETQNSGTMRAMTDTKVSNPADDFADIRADSRGTAQQKAKTALRNQNKKEWLCSIKAVGNPRMVAGVTFFIKGYGVYDGKYIADTVTHTLTADEYTNDIDGHRVLEGY